MRWHGNLSQSGSPTWTPRSLALDDPSDMKPHNTIRGNFFRKTVGCPFLTLTCYEHIGFGREEIGKWSVNKTIISTIWMKLQTNAPKSGF